MRSVIYSFLVGILLRGCCLEVVNNDPINDVNVQFSELPIAGGTNVTVSSLSTSQVFCFRFVRSVDVYGEDTGIIPDSDQITVGLSPTQDVRVVWDGSSWSTE